MSLREIGALVRDHWWPWMVVGLSTLGGLWVDNTILRVIASVSIVVLVVYCMVVDALEAERTR